MVTERFNVFLVRLDPTAGAETAKTRPCVVVSPDKLNRAVSTVIITPMTTTRRGWPTRIEIPFRTKPGKSPWIRFVPWINHVWLNGLVNWILKRRTLFLIRSVNCSRRDSPATSLESFQFLTCSP